MTTPKKKATTVAKKPAVKTHDQFVFIPTRDWDDAETFKDEKAVLEAVRGGHLDITNGKLYQIGGEVQMNVEFKPVQTFEKAVSIVK